MNFRDRKEITLSFTDAPAALRGNGLVAGFGAPILSWNAENGQDEEFCRNAYHVLTRWINLDTLTILSRPLGIFREVTWVTNQIPKPAEDHAALQGPEDMPKILDAAKLTYQSLILSAWSGEDEDLPSALLHLREFMRRNGVDPDPGNLIAAIKKFAGAKSREETT